MVKTMETILSKTNHNARADLSDFTPEMLKTLTDLKKSSAWLPRVTGRLWSSTHKVGVSFSDLFQWMIV